MRARAVYPPTSSLGTTMSTADADVAGAVSRIGSPLDGPSRSSHTSTLPSMPGRRVTRSVGGSPAMQSAASSTRAAS